MEIRGRAVADGVELSVSDQCGGISQADMDRVFDLAWRGAAARTPVPVGGAGRDSGAGLGLAIVKGIVEAHRGVVRVENVVPVGAGRPGRLPVPGPAAWVSPRRTPSW